MTTVGLRVLFSIVSFFALACSFAADKAARAIIVKGDVTFVVDGKSEKVERNKWLPEGAEVITQKGSFAKLMFIDRSSINVGPESQMKIETFPQDKAGIISLVKGKIRSKVTKNYMDNKEKLFQSDSEVGIYLQIPLYKQKVADVAEDWLNVLQQSKCKIQEA